MLSAVLAVVLILSGVRYITSQYSEDSDKAKKTAAQAFIGLISVLIACPTVNYIVYGTDVRRFECECVSKPPPTTTTSTTTTTWIYRTVTTMTTTTTTTTTSTTTPATWPQKSNGGRFLLVGNHKFMDWAGYHTNDIYGVIFNMDGTIYKNPFYIDRDLGPVAVTVGPNRFFVAYGSNAVVLDWDGQTIKSKFETKKEYIPVKAIYYKDHYYLFIVPHPHSGECLIQKYSVDGNLKDTYPIEIDGVNIAGTNAGAMSTIVPEADMALKDEKLLIVWRDKGRTTDINGIGYDINGKKIKDKFTIEGGITASCTHAYSGRPFINPQVESGKNFLISFEGKNYVYDTNMNLIDGPKDSGLKCIHDLTYGDGKYLGVEDNKGVFYDENGNRIGNAYFGGHQDVFTHLAYGNKMYVGVVAIHLGSGDGIGASFVDSTGKHIIDTMPLEMAESPGWAAYDW